MIIAGLFGMSSKFVECTLGLKYRRQNPDGSVSGGPMYYLRDGLAKKGNAGLGKVLAALFAIACIGGSFRRRQHGPNQPGHPAAHRGHRW